MFLSARAACNPIWQTSALPKRFRCNYVEWTLVKVFSATLSVSWTKSAHSHPRSTWLGTSFYTTIEGLWTVSFIHTYIYTYMSVINLWLTNSFDKILKLLAVLKRNYHFCSLKHSQSYSTYTINVLVKDEMKAVTLNKLHKIH